MRMSMGMGMGMAFASLPGVGRVKDPKPEHYRAAINHLVNDIRRNPIRRHQFGHAPTDPREVLATALWRTLRRMEWTPARLRQARAA